MAEMDLAAVLKAASDEKLATNAQTFTGFLKEADNSLKTFDGIIDHLDKIYGFINKLERSPLVGTLFRQTYGSDKIGPLIKDDGGIQPKTNAHAQIMNNLNALDEHQLKELLQRLVEVDQKKLKEEEEKNAKANDKSKPTAD